jgi:hypothetical protein
MTDLELKERCETFPPGDKHDLPFSCFGCGKLPTHLSFTDLRNWVWTCSNDACNGSGYDIPIAELKDHASALHWTIHLTGKLWFPATNVSWHFRLQDLLGKMDTWTLPPVHYGRNTVA